VVIAGLERHVKLGVLSRGTRPFESLNFRVIAPSASVPALTDHYTVANHDRSYQRVRRRGVTSMLCEFACAPHKTVARHSFLSPIRTLTVGAGLRPCLQAFTGSTLRVV
jgi:hypothetical protein